MPSLYPPLFYVVPALSSSLLSQASSWESRPPLADFTSSSLHPQQSGFQPPLHSPWSCQGHADLCIYRSNGSSACLTLLDLPNAFGTRKHSLFHWIFPNFQLSPLLSCPRSTSKSVSKLNSLSFPPNQTIPVYFIFLIMALAFISSPKPETRKSSCFSFFTFRVFSCSLNPIICIPLALGLICITSFYYCCLFSLYYNTHLNYFSSLQSDWRYISSPS